MDNKEYRVTRIGDIGYAVQRRYKDNWLNLSKDGVYGGEDRYHVYATQEEAVVKKQQFEEKDKHRDSLRAVCEKGRDNKQRYNFAQALEKPAVEVLENYVNGVVNCTRLVTKMVLKEELSSSNIMMMGGTSPSDYFTLSYGIPCAFKIEDVSRVEHSPSEESKVHETMVSFKDGAQWKINIPWQDVLWMMFHKR